MKKLLLIVSIIALTLLFAEWDVDPNYTDLTVENLEADSTIINDYLLVGDTTTIAGGFIKKDNKIEIWRDTLSFHSYWRLMTTWYKNAGRIWMNDRDETFKLMIECYGDGAGTIVFRSDECIPDTHDLEIFANSFYPGVDTGGAMGMGALGLPLYRFRQANVRHFISTDPGKGDSLHLHMEADTAYYESENPNKFDNDMFIDGEFETSGKILVGAGDSLTKFVKIGSHCAVIVNAADTFWLAADTTGF